FHGPRSQMMRCIDHPTMLKDGSGWGAMAGVSAAMLAAAGFPGAPAVKVEAPETAAIRSDLGTRWRITEPFFKPYAVCRWAQPAIEGALALQREHALDLDAIKRIEVSTFHNATRLTTRRPATTDQAQYSTPFPIAAALVHGQLGLAQLDGAGLRDSRVLLLADHVELVDDPALTARFPAERVARVRIETNDGVILDSGDIEANWDAARPPSDDELIEKFRWLAAESVSPERATELVNLVWSLADASDAGKLVTLQAVPCDA
ncbi:MAG: MmgE/PrpD family protein, partial [Thermomicrobiales bacterium]